MKRIFFSLFFAITIIPSAIQARRKKSCSLPCRSWQPATRKACQHSLGRRRQTTPVIKQAQKSTTPSSPQEENRSLEKLIKQIKNKESYDQLLTTAQEVRSSRRETIRTTANTPLDAPYRNADLDPQPSSCPENTCVARQKIRPYRVRSCYAPCKPFCRRYGQL